MRKPHFSPKRCWRELPMAGGQAWLVKGKKENANHLRDAAKSMTKEGKDVCVTPDSWTGNEDLDDDFRRAGWLEDLNILRTPQPRQLDALKPNDCMLARIWLRRWERERYLPERTGNSLKAS